MTRIIAKTTKLDADMSWTTLTYYYVFIEIKPLDCSLIEYERVT